MSRILQEKPFELSLIDVVLWDPYYELEHQGADPDPWRENRICSHNIAKANYVYPWQYVVSSLSSRGIRQTASEATLINRENWRWLLTLSKELSID